MFTRTKFVCTIGPSVSSEEQLEKLALAGMNVARLNFSHGTHQEHSTIIDRLKKLRKKLNIPLAIMLDTKGPEIRLGEISGGALSVKTGEKITLSTSISVNSQNTIPITPTNALERAAPQMRVLIDDGYVSGIITEVISPNEVVITIQNDGVLKTRKGVNIPHGTEHLPAMTAQDELDLTFGCEQGVDIIAASFIRSPENIVQMKQFLATKGDPNIIILAKIESAEGVKNFDAILRVSDGIMVARGDLGVELPFTQVPKLQKMMIRKTLAAQKPVVTATQMLESMIVNPRPTRAEVSDVANAIYDLSSAVMLSGETAIGKYPIEAVSSMRSIVAESEKDVDYQELFYRDMSRLKFRDVPSCVAQATVKTAYSADTAAIFVFTQSGFTAKALSRFRPSIPLIAVTADEKVYHQLALYWGVIPLKAEVSSLQEGFKIASQFALEKGFIAYGDLVVCCAGSTFGISGTTNMMIVDYVGDVVARGIGKRGEPVTGVVFRPSKERKIVDGGIVILRECDYTNIEFKTLSGIVLQNAPEEIEFEEKIRAISERYKIPLIVQIEPAIELVKNGETVTLDPLRGLIFRGEMRAMTIMRKCEL